MTTHHEEMRRQIAERAYELYELRGGTEGLAEEDWFQAEREIAGMTGSAVSDAGPNVPLRSGGIGEKANEVMADVKESADRNRPLPPPGE